MKTKYKQVRLEKEAWECLQRHKIRLSAGKSKFSLSGVVLELARVSEDVSKNEVPSAHRLETGPDSGPSATESGSNLVRSSQTSSGRSEGVQGSEGQAGSTPSQQDLDGSGQSRTGLDGTGRTGTDLGGRLSDWDESRAVPKGSSYRHSGGKAGKGTGKAAGLKSGRKGGKKFGKGKAGSSGGFSAGSKFECEVREEAGEGEVALPKQKWRKG